MNWFKKGSFGSASWWWVNSKNLFLWLVGTLFSKEVIAVTAAGLIAVHAANNYISKTDRTKLITELIGSLTSDDARKVKIAEVVLEEGLKEGFNGPELLRKIKDANKKGVENLAKNLDPKAREFAAASDEWRAIVEKTNTRLKAASILEHKSLEDFKKTALKYKEAVDDKVLSAIIDEALKEFPNGNLYLAYVALDWVIRVFPFVGGEITSAQALIGVIKHFPKEHRERVLAYLERDGFAELWLALMMSYGATKKKPSYKELTSGQQVDALNALFLKSLKSRTLPPKE